MYQGREDFIYLIFFFWRRKYFEYLAPKHQKGILVKANISRAFFLWLKPRYLRARVWKTDTYSWVVNDLASKFHFKLWWFLGVWISILLRWRNPQHIIKLRIKDRKKLMGNCIPSLFPSTSVFIIIISLFWIFGACSDVMEFGLLSQLLEMAAS